MKKFRTSTQELALQGGEFTAGTCRALAAGDSHRFAITAISGGNEKPGRTVASAATARGAKNVATELASSFHYGTAIVDTKTGRVDWGFGWDRTATEVYGD